VRGTNRQREQKRKRRTRKQSISSQTSPLPCNWDPSSATLCWLAVQVPLVSNNKTEVTTKSSLHKRKLYGKENNKNKEAQRRYAQHASASLLDSLGRQQSQQHKYQMRAITSITHHFLIRRIRSFQKRIAFANGATGPDRWTIGPDKRTIGLDKWTNGPDNRTAVDR